MRRDNEIAGMKVGGGHILQQHAVMAIEREQRVVPLLGFGEIGKGPDSGRSVVLSTRLIEPSILNTLEIVGDFNAADAGPYFGLR
jgi:hypothetical protein